MNCSVHSSARTLGRHDGHLVLVPSDRKEPLGPVLDAVLGSLGIDLDEMDEGEGFAGREGQDLALRIVRGEKHERVLLVGIGPRGELTPMLLRRRLQRAGAVLRSRKIARPAVYVPGGMPVDREALVEAAVIGLHLGAGRRTSYARNGKGSRAVVRSVQLVIPRADARKLARVARRAATIAQIIVEVRSWVTEPANRLGPDDLARRAASLGRPSGVRCEIWKQDRIRRERLGMLDAVGRGSSRKPRLVRMRWSPKRGRGVPHVVLVGKGIVFDTGGLSLKPVKSMPAMKNDMAGAAAVAGAIAAAGALGLRVRVTALLPIAENTPSSTSYRPGDVIGGRAGKSVEIITTDAEGRLVMADALAMAAEMKPDAIVDVATLTGSCMVALGAFTAGLWSSDDALAGRLLAAAEATGESMWRMPLLEEIMPFMRSDVADLRNTQADAYGGAIAAALFLREFAGDRPWAHLDIAGPAYHDRRTDVGPRGATGYAVSTLVRYLADLSAGR